MCAFVHEPNDVHRSLVGFRTVSSWNALRQEKATVLYASSALAARRGGSFTNCCRAGMSNSKSIPKRTNNPNNTQKSSRTIDLNCKCQELRRAMTNEVCWIRHSQKSRQVPVILDACWGYKLTIVSYSFSPTSSFRGNALG